MKKSILKKSIILAIILLFSKALSFVRSPVIANLFGAGSETDAFFGAFTITTMLFAFITPTITASIIPSFASEKKKEGEARAWSKMAGLIVIFGGVLLILTLIFYIFAPNIVEVFSPDYDEATKRLMIKMVRIMSPLILFMPLFSFATALLNAQKRFYWPGILPILGNALVLVFIFLLYSFAGIKAVAIGVLIGSVVQFLVIYAILVPRLLASKGIFNGLSSVFESVKRVGIPVFLAAVVFNFNFIVMLRLSASAGSGTYSYLTYGIRLQQVFLNLLFGSFATVIFPYLSDLSVIENKEKFKEIVLYGIKVLVLLLVPVSALLIILRKPMVGLIYTQSFERGDLLMGTSLATAFFGLSLVAFGVGEIVIRAFYAQKDAKTPLIVTVVGVSLTMVYYWLLKHTFNGLGLALAYSLGAMTTSSIGLIYLHRKLNWDMSDIVIFLLKTVSAGFVVFLTFGFVYNRFINDAIKLNLSGILMLGLFSLTLVLAYVGTAWLIGVREVSDLTTGIGRLIKGSKLTE